MTGVGFLVSVVGDGVWRVSGCVFSAGFHVVVVVDVVVVYAAVAAVVAAALALCREDNPRSLLLRLFPLSSGRVALFRLRSFFPDVVAPASFGVVGPEIPPLPSFPRSPGEKGDGSLGGPLASAKGLRAPPRSGARARPLAGDRAGRGV